MPGGPKLSAVLIVGPLRERGRAALDGLAAQTAIDDMEIVVIDLAPPTAPPLEIPSGARGRVLARPGLETWGQARAEALRYAEGDVVAFIEDHCVPEPRWAEALIAAHEGPWVAVGYAFTNLNDDRYFTRACLFHDYGPWMHPARRGPGHFLPSNNVSYKRALLEEFADGLETVYAIDFNLHEELRARGLPLFVEAQAIVAHENFTRIRDLCQASYNFCRLMAANRVQAGSWSVPRRLLYGLGAPLGAPAIKLARLAATMRGRSTLWPGFVLALPVIAVVYLWSAVGEAIGYLAGPGDTARRFTAWEVAFDRSGPA